MRAPDASGLAQGIAQVEAGVINRYEKAREEADTALLMELNTEADSFESNLKYNPQTGIYSRQGRAAINLSSDALSALDRKYSELEGKTKNPQQRARLKQMLAPRRSRIEKEANVHEFDQMEAYKTDAANGVLESSIMSAALHSDDMERVAEFQRRGVAVIQSEAQRKGLPPEMTQVELTKFNTDLAGSVIQMMTPSKQMEVLAGSDLAGLMEPNKRMAMQRAAVQGVEAEMRMNLVKEERALRIQERNERLMNQEITKQGDRLLATGELSEEWIEDNRDTMGPAEYRYFYKQLRDGGNINTDPQQYADLRIRASQGEDVRDEARERVRRGSLGLADYDKLVNASEANSPASSVPNTYKRGNDYIRSALRVSDINPDPASAQRLASALDDWNQWVADNPDANSTESRQEYMRVTQEYTLIDYEQMTLTKRMPRFAAVPRTNMDLSQLEQAGRETVRAFQAGEISENTLNEQAMLIREWEDALRRRQEVMK
tara:strand:+ start:380 stop:1849 length:1470 start_codon:yes stop_codon:yes gene_type:complete